MKLYITPGSPYARMARIVVLEKRLESRVEVIVSQTRKPSHCRRGLTRGRCAGSKGWHAA